MALNREDTIKALEDCHLAYDKVSPKKRMSLKTILEAGYRALSMSESEEAIPQLADIIMGAPTKYDELEKKYDLDLGDA